MAQVASAGRTQTSAWHTGHGDASVEAVFGNRAPAANGFRVATDRRVVWSRPYPATARAGRRRRASPDAREMGDPTLPKRA
jgi:hypothetical protein